MIKWFFVAKDSEYGAFSGGRVDSRKRVHPWEASLEEVSFE